MLNPQCDESKWSVLHCNFDVRNSYELLFISSGDTLRQKEISAKLTTLGLHIVLDGNKYRTKLSTNSELIVVRSSCWKRATNSIHAQLTRCESCKLKYMYNLEEYTINN